MNTPTSSNPLKKIYRLFGLLGLTYAVTVGSFGLLGYINKGSHISLITGSFFGLLLLFFAAKLLTEKRWALYAFTTTNALLCAVFFIRFLKTKTLYPSLLLFFISVLSLFISMKIMKQMPKKAETRDA